MFAHRAKNEAIWAVGLCMAGLCLMACGRPVVERAVRLQKVMTKDTGSSSKVSSAASVQTTGSVDTETIASSPVPTRQTAPAVKKTVLAQTIRFKYIPRNSVRSSYEMDDPADQHRIVIPEGIEQGARVPVVLAFHGQPSRKKDPRDYNFFSPVMECWQRLTDEGKIRKSVLVLPVFRFRGGNWPLFNPARFLKVVAAQLEQRQLEMGQVVAFGHSGAAGCGGGGLNLIDMAVPMAVGFFDTCLGKGWQEAVGRLQKRGIKVVNIHSVETAAFRPRQFPEYQSTFDFGRAYGPLGLKPVDCPPLVPAARLRDQPFRCAATDDGVVEAYVIDTGQGEAAHQQVLMPATSYFLTRFLPANPLSQ